MLLLMAEGYGKLYNSIENEPIKKSWNYTKMKAFNNLPHDQNLS